MGAPRVFAALMSSVRTAPHPMRNVTVAILKRILSAIPAQVITVTFCFVKLKINPCKPKEIEAQNIDFLIFLVSLSFLFSDENHRTDQNFGLCLNFPRETKKSKKTKKMRGFELT